MWALLNMKRIRGQCTDNIGESNKSVIMVLILIVLIIHCHPNMGSFSSAHGIIK